MKLACLAALVIAAAPLAHAQAPCAEVARINAAGLGLLESIEGAYASDDASDEIVESRATLFGATDCLIDKMHEPVHICTWRFPAEAEMRAAYERFAAQIDPCLAGWEKNGLALTDASEPGYRILAGVGYIGVDPHDDITWVIMGDYDPGRPMPYHLRIETTVYFD
jgi:hypothetical protein